jgi:3',5'-nucleoside bisphosphate phosphatase
VFRMDTHVHSCLSPCAELDMHPAALVAAAMERGLDALAVCDHNSAENAAAVQRAGRKVGLAVWPGMEITSAEEVHILGLLPSVEAALALQEQVYESLPGRNDERVFGLQVIADEHAEVIGFSERLLCGATTLEIERVVEAIHLARGLAVASHVDREGFGIFGQLGIIPAGLPLDALEISRRSAIPDARKQFAPQGEFPLVYSSDAHVPKDIGCGVTFALMQEPTIEELRRALIEADGRFVLGGGRPLEDLALHILDIAQNSIEAGATRIEIALEEELAANLLSIEVRDNGCGMETETVAHAADPFFTTRKTRRVGLGLALLAEASRRAGGAFSVDSQPGKGTRIYATFQHRHIDRAPVGDIETTLMVLMAGQPNLRIRFQHRVAKEIFELDSEDLRASGIDLQTAEGLAALRQAIRQGEAGLDSA